LAGSFKAQGITAVAISGVGAFSPKSGPAAGAFSSVGIGATSFVLSAKGSMAVTSAGTGAFLPILAAQSRIVLASVGSGAFLPTMRAGVSASASMTGSGGFNPLDLPGSTISFGGVGAFAAVAYAFFSDAEKAGPRQELRVAYVPYDPFRFFEEAPAPVPAEERVGYAAAEERVAVVPFEDRVYQSPAPRPEAHPPNRRRTL